MLVTVQSAESVSTIALPEEVRGAYGIRDAAGTEVALAEAATAQWSVRPAARCRFVASSEEALLVPNDQALIFALEGEGGTWTIVCRPSHEGDKTTQMLRVAHDAHITIGRARDNALVYDSCYVSAHHAELAYLRDSFTLMDLRSSNGVFLNGRRIPCAVAVRVEPGDIVSILGLRITVGSGFISLNDPEGALRIAQGCGLMPVQALSWQGSASSSQHILRRRAFHPALRFARSIACKEVSIDPPPPQEAEDETPLLMRVGPSLFMVMASCASAAVSLTYLTGQGGSMLRALPLLAMAFAMLMAGVLWPVINKRYQRTRRSEREARRRMAYAQYLSKIQAGLAEEAALQMEILEENRIAPRECLHIAHDQDVRLMARTPLHADRLELRLGRGEVPLCASIRYPEARFAVDEDELHQVLRSLQRKPRILTNAPLGYRLTDGPIIGIVGSQGFTDAFLRGCLIQIFTLHPPTDVKVALLGDEATAQALAPFAALPHCFSADRSVRFYAASLEEANVVGMHLRKLGETRLPQAEAAGSPSVPFVVLACPAKDICCKARIVKEVLASPEKAGCAVIACARHIHELPAECHAIIGEGEADGAFLLDRKDPRGKRVPFAPDPPVSDEEVQRFALDLAAARLDGAGSGEQLPDKLAFLEMHGVSCVEHLNIAKRWRTAHPTVSLAARIGVDAAGDAITLDLHEDFHGPHGLIAGTTGSGKSELIITFVLSLALSFSPVDVAFVLIDYKGGGLARTFDNDRFRLPHVAGTITNLDGSAIVRSLASLQSELRRRQRLFNEAREALGGDSVDIYAYQSLYRQGKVSRPCPHLIVIADEFAELKQQEPAFMDELISASRIGRSLGVHLVLATQKPSGVVNDQIWSNARFKIALKVADAADSQEIIKRPDAAGIAKTGRFFLLVGSDELFQMGQSGYAGASYRPGVDAHSVWGQAVSYLSNTGRILLSQGAPSEPQQGISQSQAVAVAESIVSTAHELGLQAEPLWLPALSERITLDELQEPTEQGDGESASLAPLIGRYDAPAKQAQGVLRLPLADEGNALIYGSADAGAELVVRAALLSALRQHTARTLHAYVLDMGSQSLRAFAEAPQVGGVIGSEDAEKLRRFFPFMDALIARRREALALSDGSANAPGAQERNLPWVLVVVNGIAALLDAHPECEEQLIALARGSAFARMRLIVVSETATAMRMRLRSYFRQVIACGLPDPADYGMVLGPLQGAAIPHGYGRGLVRVEDMLCEFQAAHASSEGESDIERIQADCQRMRQEQTAYRAALSVPLPPAQVLPDMLASRTLPVRSVPYGIFDDDLSTAAFDFAESALVRCVFLKPKVGASFMQALIQVLLARGESEVVVLDLARLLPAQPLGCAFATRKHELAIHALEERLERRSGAPAVVLISGMSSFLQQCPAGVAADLKGRLKSLEAGTGARLVLCDVAADAPSVHEDWLRAHMTSRDGLWIGPGIGAQSAIGMSYSDRLLPDAKMSAQRGYIVEGGTARLVHMVSCEGERRAE